MKADFPRLYGGRVFIGLNRENFNGYKIEILYECKTKKTRDVIFLIFSTLYLFQIYIRILFIIFIFF